MGSLLQACMNVLCVTVIY